MSRRFTHRDPGTAETVWRPVLAQLPELDVPGPSARVVVLAAHPDDECLGAGGLMHLAAARGASVTVVIATDGEASHPKSPSHSRDRLRKIRRSEVPRALARLSSAITVRFLGLPDGGLRGAQAELGQLLEPLVADATHLVSPWRHDGHPDHEACAAVATELATQAPPVLHWQYPIWAWHWSDPATDSAMWQDGRRVSLPPATRAAKQAALAEYASQYRALSAAPGDEALLPPAVAAHFERDVETFLVVTSPIAPIAPLAPAATADYFDQLYATSADPWGLAERYYEQRKRELLVATLPRERFRRAFEPGCANGELTVRLAERCDAVVAWDGAMAAVAATRARCDPERVTVSRSRIPDAWPQGWFDLIVLSEVGYYCPDLSVLVARIRGSLAADAVVVACHWRHPAADHPHGGDAVHAALDDQLGLHRLVRHQEADFMLEVWAAEAASVAQREGLLD